MHADIIQENNLRSHKSFKKIRHFNTICDCDIYRWAERIM